MVSIQARPAAIPAPVPAWPPDLPVAPAAQAPVFEPPSDAEGENWAPEMVHATTLAKLKLGDWPCNQVIGARLRTFPIPLSVRLNANRSLTPGDFREALEKATFTSLDDARLQSRGFLPTGLGTAAKWYFVKSSWDRVYAFHDTLWGSTAKEDASRWAAHLAAGHRDPQFAPNGLDDNGFGTNNTAIVGGAENLPPPGPKWFCFDLM